MLTITAVTMSAGTRVFSSVTNVPPMVWRVLVSQLGEPSETVPISRATRPRATPTTRARRTCAANGTRRRRASTRRGAFREFGRGRRAGPASTAGGRHPSEVQGTPTREPPQVLHGLVNARAPQESSRLCGASRSVGPDRPALLQERGHALAGTVELAGGGHHLDRGGVGVPLG